MRNSLIKLAMSAALVFLGTLSWGETAAAIELNNYDISGPWTSQFGEVTLKEVGKDTEGQIVVSGSWNNSGSVSEIVYGRYIPATASGALTIEYYIPGRKNYGYAEFKLGGATGVFAGKYYENNESGDWSLSRPKGFVPAPQPKLATITSLGENKRSTVLANPAGKWDSTFGPVELEAVGFSRGISLKGKFTREDGKVGKIVSGSYIRDGRGGLLKFQYITPWNNRSGTGTFRPDTKVANRQLLGVYDENGQKGQWILSRPFVK